MSAAQLIASVPLAKVPESWPLLAVSGIILPLQAYLVVGPSTSARLPS